MTRFQFAEIRAAHNATKAKWQRARELAAQHLEERKQRELEKQESSRRGSKASVIINPEELLEVGRQRSGSKEPPTQSGMRSSGTKDFNPRPRVLSKESTATSSRLGSKESPSRRNSQASSMQGTSVMEEDTEDPRRFLWRFGYFRGPPQPELTVDVTGHSDYSGSSWLPGQEKEEYSVACTLRWNSRADTRVLQWKTKMKLSYMRARLHDRIKKEMGPEYNEHFQETRFAHLGGMKGTTTRLRNWFQTLTGLANEGHLKTELLAMLLRELQVPIPEKSDEELDELQQLLVPIAEEAKTKSPSPAHRARDNDVPQEPEVPVEPYTNKHGPFVMHAQHLVVAL